MKNIISIAIVLGFLSPQLFALKTENSDHQFYEMTELSLFANPYGFNASVVDLHAYLTIRYQDYEHHVSGNYANEGAGTHQHSSFIPYNGYLNLASQLRKNLKIEMEAEFEKIDDVKITKLRGIWHPSKYIAITVGRDFSLLGIKEKVYYPTSEYRLFTIRPFLHYAIKRDTGVYLHGEIPWHWFSATGKIFLDTSITNGPGIDSTKVKTNTEGYMYEKFHYKTAQTLDNNRNKPITVRTTFAPWNNFEFGASYLEGEWDKHDTKRWSQFILGHFLLDLGNLVLISEYVQVKFESPNDSTVTQFSGYVSAGFIVIKNVPFVKLLQPVVRYEIFDPWKEDPARKGYRQSISAGFVYVPFAGVKLKAAYQLTQEPYGPKLDNNGFSSEMIFEF